MLASTGQLKHKPTATMTIGKPQNAMCYYKSISSQQDTMAISGTIQT